MTRRLWRQPPYALTAPPGVRLEAVPLGRRRRAAYRITEQFAAGAVAGALLVGSGAWIAKGGDLGGGLLLFLAMLVLVAATKKAGSSA